MSEEDEYIAVQPDNPLSHLQFRFPDCADEFLLKSIDDNTVDGVLNLDICVKSLIKFGADSDSAFRRRKQAVVFERGATHKATFSTNKVGYKDSDIWEGVVDDDMRGLTGDETDDDDEEWSLFDNMLAMLDACSANAGTDGPEALFSSGNDASLSAAPAADEYMIVEETLEEQTAADKARQLNRMTRLLPDVDLALIEAAIENSEDGGEQAYLDLLSGGGAENEYLEVEAQLKAGTLQATRSSSATAPADSKRWQDRQDVIDGGFVASLDSKTVKRQEAIAEVAASESAYLKDVAVLLNVLLKPMQQMSIAGTPVDESVSHEAYRAMVESVEALLGNGTNFLRSLRKRQTEAIVVESISDLFQECLPNLELTFSAYCSTSMHLQQLFKNMAPGTKKLIAAVKADPLSRSLPPDAFVLAPIQRVARYPMLLQAVAERTDSDHPDADRTTAAQAGAKGMAQMINARLRTLEDHATLETLNAQLDFSRIANPQDIRSIRAGAAQDYVDRALVKRGRLQVVSFSIDKKSHKVSKSQRLEFMLFTDMLVYAKPIKGEKKFVVYKQIHRSLVEIAAYDAAGKNASPGKKAQQLNLIEFTLIGAMGEAEKVYVNCKSTSDRERWLAALAPKLEADEFAVWDCPQGRIVQSYDARQVDELTLRQGDIVNIISRGDPETGMYKGVIVGVLHATSRDTKGWFPRRCIKEIVSVHQEAKVLKANYKLKQHTSK
jgi:hypothetical protein